jgi:hypothetical protein
VYTTLHGYALDTFQVMDPQVMDTGRASGHYRDLIASSFDWPSCNAEDYFSRVRSSMTR